MKDTFPPEQAAALLAECHRRCCICHRFCGTKMELDHMIPRSDGGNSEIGNAIPVCFDCHAEIHAYNDRHPRGRKFRPDELREHKRQWLEICRSRPSIFDGEAGRGQAGPIEALVDELDFNLIVAERVEPNDLGGLYSDIQFKRAVAQGALSILPDEVRRSVMSAYVAVSRANQIVAASVQFEQGGNAAANATNRAQQAVMDAASPLVQAHLSLSQFLGLMSSTAILPNAQPPAGAVGLSYAQPPARVVGFEDQARAWAEEVITALKSGRGNTTTVNSENRHFAEWSVKQGLLVWDPVGGVMLRIPEWRP